jgi:hypothetical protein
MTLYVVRPKNQTENEPKETRVVSASHVSKVNAHVLKDFEIKRASMEEFGELRAAGVKVEIAEE